MPGIKLVSKLLWDVQMLEPEPIGIKENVPILAILTGASLLVY